MRAAPAGEYIYASANIRGTYPYERWKQQKVERRPASDKAGRFPREVRIPRKRALGPATKDFSLNCMIANIIYRLISAGVFPAEWPVRRASPKHPIAPAISASISGIVRLDAARISFEARRRADSVAPPPRFNPFWASAAEAARAGSVVAVCCWLGGGSHMAGAICISMILAFALPYFYLRRKERKNSEAFDTEYISLLERERAREKSLAAAKTKSLPVTKASFPRTYR